ncbi:response regulator transcription factor [Pseudokineococcus sp. 1T1Z-3]|uniref:response regulator transcription factor n=1 Tax=Pseudokineococcus sp. 1T1Z-3 TaxID=3132745 RepID=UPI0030987591
MTAIRVAVVDDQALLVSAFASLVSSAEDMVVVGTAADGREAVALCRATAVDVVLMDVRMPVLDGVAATRLLGELPAPPKVVVLTTFDRDDYVRDAVLAGARGFLLKDAGTEDFLGAIRAVHRGQSVFADAATTHVLAAVRSAQAALPDADADVDGGGEQRALAEKLLRRTTSRERDVLRLVGCGQSNTEIAHSLCVAETTVKTHVSSLLAKLACRDRVGLVVLAHRVGLAP